MASKISNISRPTQLVMDYLETESPEMRKDLDEAFAPYKRIFLPHLLGLPDPSQPFDPQLKKMRPRVAQPPQNSELCEKFALDRIRSHIGNNPLPSQMKQHETETTLGRRYEIALLRHERERWKIDFAEQLTDSNHSKPITRKRAQIIMKYPEDMHPEHKAKMLLFLESFCKQEKYDNLLLFAIDLNAEAQIRDEEAFLQQFNIKPEQYVKKMLPSKELTLRETASLTSAVASCVCEQMYGLKQSLWHPHFPITVLIEQIDKHGPHKVVGKFGQRYYLEPPFKLVQSICGREIWGWKPNAPRKELVDNHAVLVIGADAITDRVYFEDPLDGSDPLQPNAAKIYVMSYSNFKSKLCNLRGVMLFHPVSGQRIFDEPKENENNFALYGDFYNDY